MHVLCNPSLDAPGSLPIDDSGNNGQEISIVNNVAIGTYDFSTVASHKDSEFITEGNYVAFKDKYDKTRLYTIMSISGEDTWNVHCEDIGLDLINESATTWDHTNSPKTVEETLNPVLSDTGWVIGVNEIKEKRVATKYTSNTETWLTRIGQIMLDFDAECDFEIQMKGNTVTKQVINIYETIGEDKTAQRFIDNVNLISLSREGSIEDLCTCLKCYGNEQDGERVTITDIEYDDGRYYSPSGHVRIYDREAHKKWSRFRAYNYNGQGEFDGYINGVFEYNTTDPQVLFDKGLEELKKRSEKTVSYEVELYKLQADIGDSVQIADNIYAEKLYLSARVQSVKNHYSSNEEDTGVLENFKRLFSNPSDATTALIEQLKNQIVSVTGTEVFYQVGDSSTIPPTGEWSKNVVDVQEGKFLWTKTIFHYSDGSSTTAYSISSKGEDGESGKTSYIHIAYANSADGTKDFSLTESENKLYIGQYTDYVEEPSTDPSDYAWTRIKGENGNDGVSLYTWIKYADTPTTGMSDNPDGKQYMGIAYNKTSPIESNDYSDYAWSLITGEDGKPTGITVSPTEPEDPYTGMLWKHTGTVAGLIKNATYRWDGDSWELYLFTADNIDVQTLSAITANLGNVTAGSLKVKWNQEPGGGNTASGTTYFSDEDGDGQMRIEYTVKNSSGTIIRKGTARYGYDGVYLTSEDNDGTESYINLTYSGIGLSDGDDAETLGIAHISRLKSAVCAGGATSAGDMNSTSSNPGFYFCDFTNIDNGPYSSGYGVLEKANLDYSGNAFIQKVYRYLNGCISEIAVRIYMNRQWHDWAYIPVIGASWYTLPLTSSTVASEGRTPRYKNYGKRVELTGQVTKTSGSFTTSAFAVATLPAGSRPSTNKVFMVGDSTFKGARVAVLTSGQIQVHSANNSSYVSLDGIAFDLD